jgi:2-haloacid dehalogenase
MRYQLSHETFPVALKIYFRIGLMKVGIGRRKTRKPFKEIYELLIRRFDLDPSKSIYLDDNRRNLIPASELGFHTIHFQSPPQFEEELKKAGIKLD